MVNDFDPTQVIQRLKDNQNLLDILLQVEDFLDGLDLYAYLHWIDGEIVDGPNITRYWASITLKYPYRRMPDPRGAKRLLRYHAIVKFEKASELVPRSIDSQADFRDGTKKPKLDHAPIWLVTIKIPRWLLDDIYDQSIERYDDEVDTEAVENAEEEGLDNARIAQGDEQSEG
jgi:hypothetical protein